MKPSHSPEPSSSPAEGSPPSHRRSPPKRAGHPSPGGPRESVRLAALLVGSLLALAPVPGAGSPTGTGHADPRAAPSPNTTEIAGRDTTPAADSVRDDRTRRTPLYEAEALDITVTRSPEQLRWAPFPVSLVEADREVRSERRVSLKEVLEAVPGVQVGDRRNFSLGDRLVIRGVGSRAQFGVRGIEVLADGIPLTLPDGQATLTNLDLGSARRIEVIRGPAAALYGNAAGGVIRVQSGGFAPRPLAPELRTTLGASGFWKQELRASGSLGDADYLLLGSRLETDGFRRHAAAETYRANLVSRFRPDRDTEIRGVVNVFDMPFGRNPSTLSRKDARLRPRKARSFIVSQGAGESATQGQSGVTLTRELGDDEQLQASLWGLGRSLRNPIPGRIIDLDRRAGGLRLEVRGEARPGGFPLRWTTGLDAEIQHDDRRELENLGVGTDGERARAGSLLLDQRELVRTVGPFLRLQARPLRPLRVTLAARYDRYRFDAEDRLLADGDDSGDRTMEEISPMAGLAWRAKPWMTLYANLSTSFETPTTSELSNRPDGAGGFHPDLGPQRIESREAGVRGRSEAWRLRYQLSLYDAVVRDALVPREGSGGQVFFRNAGRISRRGAELMLAWHPVPAVRARLSYARQDFRFEDFRTPDGDFSGNREPGAPAHRLFAEVGGRSDFGLAGRVRFTWTDAFPVNDANTAFDWSSRVVDVRLSLRRRAGRWELEPFLGIDNLLDERYNASVVPNAFGGRYYEPAPGRQFFGGLSLGMGSP